MEDNPFLLCSKIEGNKKEGMSLLLASKSKGTEMVSSIRVEIKGKRGGGGLVLPHCIFGMGKGTALLLCAEIEGIGGGGRTCPSPLCQNQRN